MVSKNFPSFRGWEPEIMMVSKFGIILLFTGGAPCFFSFQPGVFVLDKHVKTPKSQGERLLVRHDLTGERNPLGQQNTWPRIESPSEESPTTNGTISVVSFDVLTGMLGEFFECQAYISSPISHIYPTGSMYGIFTYIYHTKQPNVGKYTSPMDPMGINWSRFPGTTDHQRSKLYQRSNQPPLMKVGILTKPRHIKPDAMKGT